MAVHLHLPDGWSVAESSGPGPFTTRAVLVRPDGSRVEWTSRRHRKGLGLRLLGGDRPRRRWSRPDGASIAMGLLFGVGSACFLVGSLPAYQSAVSEGTDAWTYFVGSIFFTSAAYVQFREAAIASDGPDGGHGSWRGLRRFASWSPGRIDWWASAIQLAGTLFFNVTTFAATRAGLDVVQERRWIWAPDVYGSICFLVASWMAYVEAGAGERGWRHRGTGWWIAALNMLGSIAFGVSAVAARYVRSTGEIANVPVANLGTLIGAACFLAGAVLLPVESSRDRAVASG